MLIDLLREHLGVPHGVERQERLSEARRERRLRLIHAVFSTSHLGSVARNEVEHGLLLGKFRNGWKYAASVASQEHDVCWVTLGEAGNLCIVDELDRIGAASVFRKSCVVVVNNSSDRVEDGIFQNRAELDGVEDVGFFLSRQTDALGVASPLDVEDTSIAPAVLVIADECSLGIGGKSRLASSRKTEEDGDIAILALICGRVESQDVVLDWHLVEHDGEDA